MGVFACLLTFVLLAMSAYPLRADARESRFFSKVARNEPERASPKAETETGALSPSASPFKEEEASEQGYGLFGKEETYQYSPTTTNPTKSKPGNFRYDHPNEYRGSNGYSGWSGRQGRSYGTGEKQGMSDTRFLENGRYFYDIEKENEYNGGRLTENDDDVGHESYYSHGSGRQYTGERQGRSSITGEKQGMSDTRFLENGRYFYDIEAEQKRNNGYTNNDEFYSNNRYDNGNEEEEEDDDDEFHGTEEKQGKTEEKQGKANEARFGYDVGVDEAYKNEKTNEYSEKESYTKENAQFNGKFGKGYDFRSTPNKFPNYEFDSIEEYEKYEQGRSHQKAYDP